MPDRKAASVLPLPVGAQISVCWPAEIGGHPWTCAAVGSGNDVANQARTAGEKPVEHRMIGDGVEATKGCATVSRCRPTRRVIVRRRSDTLVG